MEESLLNNRKESEFVDAAATKRSSNILEVTPISLKNPVTPTDQSKGLFILLSLNYIVISNIFAF